jgi:Cu/Ag efflux pump CusA
MRIWLKPQRMAALGITPTEIRNALSSNNYLSALGGTKGTLITVNLVANTNLKSVNEFKNLVLKERNGSIIRLQDVADIVLGAESYDTDVRFSGQKAIFMGVWVLPTSNSLDVISSVRNELPQIEKQLPSGMHVHLSYDATGYIRDALHEVLRTLTETLLIVVCVIFLFLGNWRSILVPVVAIPLSLAGALFLIQTMGFTLNLLTLLAIVLSVGLVVDEYGELQGLVTVDDILEEIVGEFSGRALTHARHIHLESDGVVLVEGGCSLRELNRKLKLSFRIDGPKTIKGRILEHLEDIPEPGTSVKIDGYPIEIVQTQDRMVKMVRIQFTPIQ